MHPAHPNHPAELRSLLHSVSRQILSLVDGAQAGPIYIEISNRRNSQLRLTFDPCQPNGRQSSAGGPTTGRPQSDSDSPAALLALLATVCFSPQEREILLALGTDCLGAKQLAARLKISCDSRLRMLLANLVDRGVLARGGGYRVADLRLLELVRAGSRQASAGGPTESRSSSLES